MIEPTETEAEGDARRVRRGDARDRARGRDEPELLKEAPHNRPVRRLDEVKAAKRAVVRYGFEEHPDLAGEPETAAQSVRRRKRPLARERPDPLDSHGAGGETRSAGAEGIGATISSTRSSSSRRR